jgi:hypothetical protein
MKTSANSVAQSDEATLRDLIGEAFGIGKDARNNSVIMANIENAIRRAACLSAIEGDHFTRTVQNEDGEEVQECLLSYGDDIEQYSKTMGLALQELSGPNPSAAAIEYALELGSEGLEFLNAWSYGDFDVLREEWPEAPEAIYDGADSMHTDYAKSGGDGQG